MAFFFGVYLEDFQEMFEFVFFDDYKPFWLFNINVFHIYIVLLRLARNERHKLSNIHYNVRTFMCVFKESNL